MQFAVTGGGLWLAWMDGAVRGSDHLVSRVRRAEERGRRVGGYSVDLRSPDSAYRAFVGVIREYGGYHGVLDVAATDDDGLPMAWLPEPDAESPPRDSPPAVTVG